MPEAKPSQSAADSPGEIISRAADRRGLFSDSRGLVRISASDGAQMVGDYGEADLGTQFAFATSIINENNRLAVTGDIGYTPMTGAPATALRTRYSRKVGFDSNPSFSVTMRQFFVPTHVGQTLSSSNESSMPMLRTLGFSFSDKRQIGDLLSFEYGSEIDMVSLGDHGMQYFSPYARLAYAIPNGSVDVTYTSGNPRPELGLAPMDGNTDLQRDLEAVSLVPRVTLLNHRPRVEYGQDLEAGVTQRFGSREYRVSTYRENVSNTSLTIANPTAGLFEGDVMPDLFSSSGLFNAGRFQTSGYILSATQDLGSNFKVTAMFGSLGVLSIGDAANLETADDLRTALESHHRAAFDLKGSGTIHRTGTRFMASYEWTDYKSALPGPMFSTQTARPQPGLNIMVRQPIPLFSNMPGHLEACAEMRNLLAQGYMPIAVGGQSILLVNTPRSLRGGLAFVF
jgi:hypothetical protein